MSSFVFEEVAKRFHQLEAKIGRQAAHVVMSLDPVSVDRVVAGALDDVGIEGALGQEVDVVQRCRFDFEDLDEGGADPAPLLLRIDHPLQRAEELVASVDGPKVDAEMTRHHLLDPPPFVATQQTVVDQQAGQLPRNGSMHEGGADRRIDPA